MSAAYEIQFHGDRSLIAHTGLRTFGKDVRWKASEREEGFLVTEDGSVRAVMPGCEIRPGCVTDDPADLFVFRRGATVSGYVGAGNIMDETGVCRGGHGRFTCTVLLPRKLLRLAYKSARRGVPLTELLASAIRPGLVQAMETAVARPDAPGGLRASASRIAFSGMRDVLLTHGLLLENFELMFFDRMGDSNVHFD